ncbi:PREDICTED: uncharacterized protein LOC108567813 [Nicrophorus vespilloides]|uniref:Uncharacterized protein LOC108567813 n=1 Tax=Nicrophorus vespilloides TaxID=110193 RepID=A0ABM1NAZ5_NICVS|nr:PREDICTED: uncharacterized protein LOC108567813 [Nicrophorus vespilloides]
MYTEAENTMCNIKSACWTLVLLITFEIILAQDGAFFLKASKSVPRIGKRNRNENDENFRKIFLKASKSVPRIGRRDFVPAMQQKEIAEKYENWSDIADLYEYYPELFSSPQLLSQFEDYKMYGDQIFPEKMHMKRKDESELREFHIEQDN